jgi:hypothetical protein
MLPESRPYAKFDGRVTLKGLSRVGSGESLAEGLPPSPNCFSEHDLGRCLFSS